ncbi:hypothetical protein BCR34DRAFT_523440 [Clohesyomyces aquaticus]|uniref:ferric-chelate reductase (NADPH) n=1 Tax=Clohesyomyces aquaticus TaxID=1231657 RepID=A0A1Y1YLJ8_9PLEO|nr:hypothetical protein BCR34DRAFT_523440 [Clohesyomyces aquaticus]
MQEQAVAGASPHPGSSNEVFVQLYWCLILGAVGFIYLSRWCFLRQLDFARWLPISPGRRSIMETLCQCGTSTRHSIRALSYIRLYLPRPLSSFSPPPLGRTVIVLSYWGLIATLSTFHAFINDASYIERVAYRFGWMALAQIPLVYITASKRGFFGFLLGRSHEHLNWFHRWASRAFVLTTCVHGALFLAEYSNVGMLELELQLMPMVKYGLGAGGILIWTLFSTIGLSRRLGYRFFALQHTACAVIFLWMIYKHLVSAARKYLWPAVILFAVDRGIRLILFGYYNISVDGSASTIGSPADTVAISSDVTVLTLRNFKHGWRPGQYFYVWIPKLGLLESHPYTCSSDYSPASAGSEVDLQFVIQGRSGFARRLNKYGSQCLENHIDSLPRALVSGPYGTYPKWGSYETLIVISASTGTSFTLSILESVLHNSDQVATRRIRVLAVTPRTYLMKPYLSHFYDATTIASSRQIDYSFRVTVTQETREDMETDRHYAIIEEDEELDGVPNGHIKSLGPFDQLLSWSRRSSSWSEISNLPSPGIDTIYPCSRSIELGNMENEEQVEQYTFTYERPNVRDYISESLLGHDGDCMVVVCAGRSLVAATSNAVATLILENLTRGRLFKNDLYLYTEEFSL